MPLFIHTDFVVDRAFDLDGYFSVRDHLFSGSDFSPPRDEREAEERISIFYDREIVRLQEYTRLIGQAWHERELLFFQLASEYFSEQDVVSDRYICYPTIWPSIARDPSAHRVAFPFQKGVDEACYVLAHELLHELFYYHLHRTRFGLIDVMSKRVWDFAEALNVLIMRRTEWQQVFSFPVLPYRDHVSLVTALSPLWECRLSLDSFLHDTLFNKKYVFPL